MNNFLTEMGWFLLDTEYKKEIYVWYVCVSTYSGNDVLLFL